MNQAFKNIVSFDRGADFLHRRAIKNRASNPIDALELLRQAIGKSPDNVEYWMDLTELYYEMGLYELSVRHLAALLGNPETPPESYFGLGLNFWEMNQPASAQAAMSRYLRESEDGEYRDEVIELMVRTQLTAALAFMGDRKKKRAFRLAARGAACLEQRDFLRAELAFRRSLSFDPDQAQIRALHAYALLNLGEAASAVREALRVLNGQADLDALCVAGEVLEEGGHRAKALRAFCRAMRGLEGAEPPWMLISLALKLKLYGRARGWLRRALFKLPNKKQLLHAMAAAHFNDRQPIERALIYWERIARIDPLDAVAASYLALADQNRLEAPIPVEYEMMPEAARAKERWLHSLLGTSPGALRALWLENDALKSAVIWALAGRQARAAVHLMLSVDLPDVEGALRAGLMEPKLPGAARHQMLLALRARGARPPYASLTGGVLELIDEPGDGERRAPSNSYFQVLWLVIERGGTALGGDYRKALYLWSLYALKNPSFLPAPSQVPGWAAALTCASLAASGVQPDFHAIAPLYGCSARLARRYFSRMERLLQKEYLNDESD